MQWVVEVRRYGEFQDLGNASSSVKGFWITVEVSWHDGRRKFPISLQLVSLKLGAPR
jgi:hypothetical protein